jgi:hypothetical protein
LVAARQGVKGRRYRWGQYRRYAGALVAFDTPDTRMLLMAGISAGFGSVFGTPLAGMVFGMEVLTVGGIRYRSLIPCLVAAFVGDWTVQLLQVSHLHYHVFNIPVLTPLLVGQLVLAGLIFAGRVCFFRRGRIGSVISLVTICHSRCGGCRGWSGGRCSDLEHWQL